jgi:SAM-dependent methyltransferase
MENRQIQAIRLNPPTQPDSECLACGGGRFRGSASLHPGFDLHHCQSCGTAFTWPRLQPEELEQYYRRSYYGPENVKFISPLEKIVEFVTNRRAAWISQQVPPRSRILEIGCGRGLLLKALNKLEHESLGIERSELAATRAREIPGVTVFTTPVEECGFSDDSLDLVILWHVLEHLHDPRNVLRQIFRVLKPGGRLIIEVPNLASLQSVLTGKNWFHLDVERHLFHFTPSGLEELLHSAGFSSRRGGTFSWEQCPFGVLQSLLNCWVQPPETLYKYLKREREGTWRHKWLHFMLGGILFFPSLFFSCLEAAFQRGGILRVVAEKPLRQPLS